jgi:hypothetical protein
MDFQSKVEEIDLNSECPDLQQSAASSECSTNVQSQDVKNDFHNESNESTDSSSSSPERENPQSEEILKLNSSEIFGEYLFKEFKINSLLSVDDDKNSLISNIPESDLEKIPLIKKLKEESILFINLFEKKNS